MCGSVFFFIRNDSAAWWLTGLKNHTASNFSCFFHTHTRRNPPQREISKRRRSEGMPGARHFPDSLDLFWFSSFLISCGVGEIKGMLLLLFLFSIWVFLASLFVYGDGSFGSLSVVSRVVEDSRRPDGRRLVRLGLALYLLLLPGRHSSCNS